MVSNKKDRKSKKIDLINEEDYSDNESFDSDVLLRVGRIPDCPPEDKSKKPVIFDGVMEPILILLNLYKELSTSEGIDKSITDELVLKIVEKIKTL